MTYVSNVWLTPGGAGMGFRKANGAEVEYTAAQIEAALSGLLGAVTLTGTLTLGTATLQNALLDGTTKYGIFITLPKSAAGAGISYQRGFAMEQEFEDPTKPTTGLLATFQRDDVATGTFQDTGADFRITNNAINTTGVYDLTGQYIKASNKSGKTLTGVLTGLSIECIPDGTVSGGSAVMRVGSNGQRVTQLIDATRLLMTKYTSNKAVILMTFVDAAGTTQYLTHNTDTATALTVTASAPS